MNLCELISDVDYGLANDILVAQQWAACKRVNPVLVPKSLQQCRVKAALEERVLKLVILVCMESELLKFFSRDDSAACLLFLGL